MLHNIIFKVFIVYVFHLASSSVADRWYDGVMGSSTPVDTCERGQEFTIISTSMTTVVNSCKINFPLTIVFRRHLLTDFTIFTCFTLPGCLLKVECPLCACGGVHKHSTVIKASTCTCLWHWLINQSALYRVTQFMTCVNIHIYILSPISQQSPSSTLPLSISHINWNTVHCTWILSRYSFTAG